MATLSNDVAAAQVRTAASRFGTTVAAIELTVTVTTADGDHVGSLTANDFEIRDNGEPQALSYFATAHVPLDLAILFDTSSSMNRILPLARQAASGLLSTLDADDRVVVLGIGSRLSVLSPLSHDVTAAMRGMSAASADGETALYDAVYIAIRDLQPSNVLSADVRRRAIAVLSDGIDTASHLTFEDAIAAAKASAVAIYSIALPPEPRIGPTGPFDLYGPQAKFVMRAFASETGGRLFPVQQVTDLPGIYGQIAEELSHQYTLAYVPAPSADQKFRSIAVSVPGRPGLRIRHRAGYRMSGSAL